MLRQQLDDVRERIQNTCRRAGRDSSTVTLIGVTKRVPLPIIQAVVALGLTDVGESRVQEAETKRQEIDAWLRAQGSGLGVVARSPQPPAQSGFRVRWHLIGHLQRNKAKRAVELFDVIHSVDSRELIHDLERHAASGRVIPMLIQVNVSGEAAKFGCRPEQVATLAEAANSSAHLRLMGLMTIAPYADDAEASRPHFHRLRELRDAVDPTLKLSMGMSHDFEVAIEEGADFVRVGTAIFGDPRPETRDPRPR